MNRSCCALSFWLVCALVSVSSACTPSTPQHRAPDKPRIVAWKPGDELSRLDEAVTVVFDQDMVGIDAVGPKLEQLPLRIEPQIALRVYWHDRRTLLIQPETEWRAGGRYRLQLLPPLSSQLATPAEFQFDVQALRIGWTQLPKYNANTQVDFSADFTLPVDLTQAQDHCVLVDPKGAHLPLKTQPRKQYDGPRAVHFQGEGALPLDTTYSVACPGLTPFEGAAPWRANQYAGTFTTHGLFKVIDHHPAGGKTAAQPPERAQLCLKLSTPVKSEEIAKHVHVTPEPENLADMWFEGSCDEDQPDEGRTTDYVNSVLLAPRLGYHVAVDAELTDVFGQKLGRIEKWDFETTDRIPGLWTSTGWGSVLELGRKGHAVGTLNLDEVELSCVQLTAAQFIGAYSGVLNWTQWSPPPPGQTEASEVAEIPKAPWELLKLTPRTQHLPAGAAANVARTLPLTLNAQCGTSASHGGLYALELTGRSKGLEKLGYQGDVPARLVANVTDLAVVAKRGHNSALVWVTRLSTGALVSQATVELLNGLGAPIASAQTDARGLALFPKLPPPAADYFYVHIGNDQALVGSDWRWSDGLRPSQLGAREGDDNPTQLFVHMDRGVYRPGERVYVHGLARAVRDGAPARVPEQRAVHLKLTSSSSELVFEQKLELSDFGSFATEIALPKQIAPDSYSLDVDVAGRRDSYPLQVAEFRPLTFELTGRLSHDEVMTEQPVKLDLTGNYLFGAPLSEADVHFAVERSSADIAPPGLEAFNFSDSSPTLPDETAWPPVYDGLVSEEDQNADEAGRTQFSFNTEESHVPLRYLITASATDAANDRATRTFSVLSHSSERYAGTHMARFVFGQQEPVEAEVVLIDRHGKRVAGEADVELRQAIWECKDPTQSCSARVQVSGRQHIQVSADKATPVSFTTKRSGLVYIRVSTQDGQKRVARASDAAFVWSSASAGPYEDRVAAPLEVDQRSYHVGDKARLALQTALTPGHMLMTAERSDILSAEVIDRSDSLPSIALTDTSAPNVFLSLTGMTPRTAAGEAGRPRLVSGAKEVSVHGPTRVLETRIQLKRARYEPHERVEGTVDVSHLGKPVLAEVALVAVNESVLQLTGFETPDPTRVFQAPRGLTVGTYSNIPLVIADPAAAALVPETARMVTGEDGPGGRPDVRNDYVAAAYVAPGLRTDRNGRVSFSFAAPTDLSAYRLMAVVAAKDDRVGSADARLTVSQPIAAHVISPRFVSRGDVFEIGALVHDTTDQPGVTEVRFASHGLALNMEATHVSATPAGTPAGARATVQDVDEADFEVELHKGKNADRVRHEYSVRRPLDTELRVLALGRGPKAQAELHWPKGVDADLSRLELTIDRAGLAPLAPLVAMVMDYPYGCTEQTAAALSAIAAAPELARAIAPSLPHETQLDVRVEDGLERLRAARTEDGLFGLYPGMTGRLWLTALVLEAGLAARDAGFAVPALLTTQTAETLSTWLRGQDIAKLDGEALERSVHITALLAALGPTPKGVLDQLLARSKHFTTNAYAYALIAAALEKRPEATRSGLRERLSKLDWLKNARDSDEPLESAERTSALALYALVRDGGAPKVSDQLAAWLNERAADPSHYFSTRDIGEMLHALSSWARGKRVGGNHVRVSLGEQALWEGDLKGAQVIALDKTARAAPGGVVSLQADGDVSFSVRRRDVSVSAPKPAFAHGLTLERRYLDPRTDKPIQAVKLGDVIQLELEVRTQRALRMLAVTDPLPAGLEPMDPGLSSGRFAGCDSCDNAVFNHMRRRDDRIEAFVEWLPAGTHTIRYLLRATTAGSFSAPGAVATLMYMPDTFARSRVDQLQIAH